MTGLYCSGIASIMLAGEEDEGRKAVWPHHKRLPKWFVSSDWSCWPVLSYDNKELHIVAVASARKGALRRLIDGAAKAGLSPVVVEPIGPQMPAILHKWGWHGRIVGSGWDQREEWRPNVQAPFASVTGTGTAKTAQPVEGRSLARTARRATPNPHSHAEAKQPALSPGLTPTSCTPPSYNSPTPSGVGPTSSTGAE